jgi:fatty acid desaturase
VVVKRKSFLPLRRSMAKEVQQEAKAQEGETTKTKEWTKEQTKEKTKTKEWTSPPSVSFPKAADHLKDASVACMSDRAKGVKSAYLGLDTRLPDVSAERLREIKEKFPHFPDIVDQGAVRREYFIRLPRAVEDWANRNMICDPRDTIMLSTMVNMFVVTGTLSCLLFRFQSHKLGLFVLATNQFLWPQRFILMLHYAEHRPLFNQSFLLMRYIMPWLMAPFYGIPIGMYHTHHIAMHHKENNIFEKDLSSTEPYQRDSILHFLHYWLKFLCLGWDLPRFCIERRRWNLLFEVLAGLSCWLILQMSLWRNGNGIYCLYQFQLPFLISSLALMFGNWSQHIFVDGSVVSKPNENPTGYRYNSALSLNVINHFDNQFSFNDGYHVVHHVKPKCHWTEMPLEFMNNLEKYAEQNPIVIDRAGFFDIGFDLLIRQKFDPDGAWKWIIDRYVHFTPEKRSYEEVKALLQERLKPVPERAQKDAKQKKES